MMDQSDQDRAADWQARWSTALLSEAGADPGGLVAWNGSDPRVRLEVHRRNVMGSLAAALSDTYPVVRALVGEDFFVAMAQCAVRSMPPRTPVLPEYGAGFAEFIRQFGPASELPYLPDVARLEWARVRAWSAADRPTVTPCELHRARLAPDQLASLTVELHPSVGALASPHPVVSIWRAHQGEGTLGGLDPDRGEEALVLRDGLEVLVRHAAAGTARFVGALADGRPIGEAQDIAAGVCAAFDLAAELGWLLQHGGVCRLGRPQPATTD